MNRVYRVPTINLADLLASSPNPSIDIRLQAYEDSTRNFLKAVSNYTNRGKTEIANRRNAHVEERKKIAKKIKYMEAETASCKVKEIELMATLEREQEERKEAESSVDAFKKQLATIRQQCAAIDVEIEQYRAVTSSLRQEKDKEKATLKTFSDRMSLELHAYEQQLRCVVEGVEKNQLLVRFTALDKADPVREFSLVIDVSTQTYKVLTSTPLLPTMPILVDELNESRDVYCFIKQVRKAFQALVGGN